MKKYILIALVLLPFHTSCMDYIRDYTLATPENKYQIDVTKLKQTGFVPYELQGKEFSDINISRYIPLTDSHKKKSGTYICAYDKKDDMVQQKKLWTRHKKFIDNSSLTIGKPAQPIDQFFPRSETHNPLIKKNDRYTIKVASHNNSSRWHITIFDNAHKNSKNFNLPATYTTYKALSFYNNDTIIYVAILAAQPMGNDLVLVYRFE